MFIAEQYNFEWNDSYMDAFLSYEAPKGIEGSFLCFTGRMFGLCFRS